MKAKPVIVLTLVAVGVVVLASLCLNFLTPDKPVIFLGLNIAEGDGRFIPPIAGGFVFAAGIILLLLKSKRA